MTVELEPQQVTVIARVLVHYPSDLRMEISDREDYDMREVLKEQEEFVSAAISRFEEASVRST